jgi:metal-responsive CopG/Arc/MetJ family transcriptional regulator
VSTSYTFGMKTAISVPDPIFREADRHARRTGRSRSQLYAEAVSEYLARHSPDQITEQMNAACDVIGEDAPDRDFVRAAGKRLMSKERW